MKAHFLGQPFDHVQVGDLLGIDLLHPSANAFWFLSAWVHQPGIDALEAQIGALRLRGGTAECIVGLDRGAATREGLERAVSVMSRVFTFHDSGGRTFHPKIYVVEGPSWATVIVGSGNFTGGGLYMNFEAAVRFTLDRTQAADAAFLKELRDYFDRFAGEKRATHWLETNADIDNLVTNSGLIFAVPDTTGRPRGAGVGGASGKVVAFFGPPLAGLPGIPKGAAGTRRGKKKKGVSSSRAPTVGGRASTTALRWWKRLTASDAQRKKTGHQRGSVTLVMAGHKIDHLRYFRYEFFKAANWVAGQTQTGEPLFTARIPFHVDFLGIDLGVLEFGVTHAPNRESAQHNYTSLLHWGPLTSRISKQDLTGKWLLLERNTDRSFALSVRPTAP